MSAAGETSLDWARLGQEIRRDRRDRAMSQQQLADASGLDRKTIGHYEGGRVPTPGRIPDGYFSVARVLKWPDGRVEQYLGAAQPSARQAPAVPAASGPAPAIELYPAVIAFARACSREGADAELRDAFEEAAERLLDSATTGRARREQPASYGLAAYRPHGWAEDDPGVPADDAERIRLALEEHRQAHP